MAKILVCDDDIRDVTIYGTRVQHIDTYNINYVLGHGSFSGDYPTSFTNLQSATLVNPVANNGYEFEGWYDSNNQKVTVIDTDHYSSDVTLTAKYNLVEYTITYVATNCTNPNTVTSYNIESETITILDADANDGYEFNCWKDASNNVVTSITQGTTGNITLTANVSIVTYTITYVYENVSTGEIIENVSDVVLSDTNPTSYTIETGQIMFDEITLATGYEFGGWYLLDGEEQELYGIINPDDDLYIIGIKDGVATNL